MGSQIQISSPFLRSFTTTDTNVTTSKIQLLAPADAGVKRIVVLVQNTDATYNIQVMGNATDTAGIAVYPKSTISFDNYNGGLWVFSNSATGISVHTSVSQV
jgi:hypothetical protein